MKNMALGQEEVYSCAFWLLYDLVAQPVGTSRYFQSYADAFDDTFKFVGPSIAPRITDPAFLFEVLHDGPLLYISLGTLFHRQNEFYRCCFRAFEQSDYEAVMSIGLRAAIEQPGPIPENFIVRQVVNDLKVRTKMLD